MLTGIYRAAALPVAAAFVAALSVNDLAFADEPNEENTEHELEEHEADYVKGFPAAPSDAWVIAIGGRIYDNWVSALDAEAPKSTHAAWPASNTKKSGKTTWRCKSCHGWDFLGKDGRYASGSYQTGIKGVHDVAGVDPDKIQMVLLDDTHQFTHDMIPEQYMKWVATFLSKGQYDIRQYVSDSGEVSGDPDRGK